MSPRFGKYQWVLSPSLHKRGLLARAVLAVVGYTQMGTFRRFLWFRRALKRFIPSPRSILDAGCGAGEYAFYLAQLFPQARVRGCDSSDLVLKSRNVAQEHGISNLEFLQMDLENLSEEEAYDLILCIEVLEHIPDNRRILSRMFRALLPGGHLFIRTPVAKERRFLPRVLLRAHEEWAAKEHEALDPSLETLIPDLKKMGFEIPFSTYTSGFFGEIVFELEQLLRYLGPLFLLSLPLLKALSCLDLIVCPKAKGNGMLVVAQKPGETRRG